MGTIDRNEDPGSTPGPQAEHTTYCGEHLITEASRSTMTPTSSDTSTTKRSTPPTTYNTFRTQPTTSNCSEDITDLPSYIGECGDYTEIGLPRITKQSAPCLTEMQAPDWRLDHIDMT